MEPVNSAAGQISEHEKMTATPCSEVHLKYPFVIICVFHSFNIHILRLLNNTRIEYKPRFFTSNAHDKLASILLPLGENLKTRFQFCELGYTQISPCHISFRNQSSFKQPNSAKALKCMFNFQSMQLQ